MIVDLVKQAAKMERVYQSWNSVTVKSIAPMDPTSCLNFAAMVSFRL